MYTLGLNAAFHDSSACIVRDGEVLAAAEEERFTRIKHGKRPIPFTAYELPFHAIEYCLREAGISLCDVDHVAYAYAPWELPGLRGGPVVLPENPERVPQKKDGSSPWDPLFALYIKHAPRFLADGPPHHLAARFRGAAHDGPYRWHWVPHHLAHGASAFHASPFEEAAVMTLDGRGERATTTYGVGRGTELKLIRQVDMPHSLGMLYEQVTSYLGFLHSSDEYKVMALASYGTPRYAETFLKAIHVDGGTYRIDPLDFAAELGPVRRRGDPVEQRHFDIASSLQVALEETALALARWLRAETGVPDLCMAGGVALNCVMNARLRDRGPFERIWVQPAAGDAGTALGAALWIDARQRGARERTWRMDHAYLGPSFTNEEIEAVLRQAKLPYRRCDDVADAAAELLEQDMILGWFQGRMEFGPRALGARSILASPIHAEMQQRLNFIKDREDFRPVAPVVIEEEASRWFAGAGESPFMLFVHDVLPEAASRIPAVRHVDGTARIQTVRREQNPAYYDVLRAFQKRTGVPVLVNTSFNTRSEPIVCTPRDALASFFTTPLDALAIGCFIVEKGRRS